MTSGAPESRPFDLKDVFIVVMGVTGAGKSTFISHCTDESVKVGHHMVSCTQNVATHKCNFLYGSRTVWLVDTPGFEDTHRPEADVLHEVASWLERTYKQSIMVTGVFYLHQITMNRILGSLSKNLRVFRQLCGKDFLKRVHIVTTRWDEVDKATGIQRESELRGDKEFWGNWVQEGARIVRHQNTRESARSIILDLIQSQEDRPCQPLNIQRQMVDEGKSLIETAAGAEVAKELLEQERRHKKEKQEMLAEINKALSSQEHQYAQMLEDQNKTIQAQIDKIHHQYERLRKKTEASKEKEAAALRAESQAQAQAAEAKAQAAQAQAQVAQAQTKAAEAELEAQKSRNQQLEQQRRQAEAERQKQLQQQQQLAQAEQQRKQRLQAEAERQLQLQQQQQLAQAEHRRQQQWQAELEHQRQLQQQQQAHAGETWRLRQQQEHAEARYQQQLQEQQKAYDAQSEELLESRLRAFGLQERIEHLSRPNSPDSSESGTRSTLSEGERLQYQRSMENCNHPTGTPDGHCDDCGRPPQREW